MKKILFVASTLSHIENFHVPYLKEFKEQDFTVHIMGKPNNKSKILYTDKIIPISFEKSMLSIKNFIIAFKIAKTLTTEKYDVISIHTSLAAFFVRIAIMFCFNKPKLVINTVHGYLFDNSSSYLKKTILLLAEKLTKCVTDIIMVMNSEDYNISKKYKLYKKSLYKINGMGINLSKFSSVSHEEKINLRKKYNFSENDFLLIYVAEFSKRKNQIFLLRSIKNLIDDGFKNIKLILLGDGQFFNELKQYSKTLNIASNVFFAGYSKDSCTYYQLSDICVSSSRIEGLPFNIMEAMSVGLPIVASKIKGHTDLVIPEKNGFLFEYDNINEFCSYIETLYTDKNLQHKMQLNNENLIRNYSLDAVVKNTVNIILKESKQI